MNDKDKRKGPRVETLEMYKMFLKELYNAVEKNMFIDIKAFCADNKMNMNLPHVMLRDKVLLMKKVKTPSGNIATKLYYKPEDIPRKAFILSKAMNDYSSMMKLNSKNEPMELYILKRTPEQNAILEKKRKAVSLKQLKSEVKANGNDKPDVVLDTTKENIAEKAEAIIKKFEKPVKKNLGRPIGSKNKSDVKVHLKQESAFPVKEQSEKDIETSTADDQDKILGELFSGVIDDKPKAETDFEFTELKSSIASLITQAVTLIKEVETIKESFSKKGNLKEIVKSDVVKVFGVPVYKRRKTEVVTLIE